jgi:hypothetical protein
MTDPQKDTQRAIAAAKLIIDGRDPKADYGSILVTLEVLISLILLTVMSDPRTAAAMFTEGVVPGVEQRIALAASRR